MKKFSKLWYEGVLEYVEELHTCVEQAGQSTDWIMEMREYIKNRLRRYE